MFNTFPYHSSHVIGSVGHGENLFLGGQGSFVSFPDKETHVVTQLSVQLEGDNITRWGMGSDAFPP